MNAPRTRRTARAALTAVAVSVVAVTCLSPTGLSTTAADSSTSGEVVSAGKEWKAASRTKEW